jgi:hypothetical protein
MIRKTGFPALVTAVAIAQVAAAAVPPDEARQLGGEKMTLIGSEKGGNKEGTISPYVKGCRTPARARGKRSICTGLRAGVGQASREETAAHAAVVVEGCGAMAIGDVRRWRSGSTAMSAVRGRPGNADDEVRRRDEADGLPGGDGGRV